MEWSTQQKAIFDWFATGRENLVVRARAGTGKSTTILEATKYAPASDAKILLAAFNAHVGKELADKVLAGKARGGVQAKTLHSMGLYFCGKMDLNTEPDDKKDQRMVELAVPVNTPDRESFFPLVRDLASKMKNVNPFFSKKQDVVDVAEQFGIFEGDGKTDRIVKWAIDAIGHSLKDDRISFDDMIFIPLRMKKVFPFFNVVIVDEAQDMNTAQIELALRMVRSGGRVCVVGDDRQAIYGFRGADSGAIDRLKLRLQATELGLKTTYRCPQKVVELAQTLVPDYQAGPENPEGVVTYLTDTSDYLQIVSMAQVAKVGAKPIEQDAILSRKNAPLVGICLRLLKAGKKAKVIGRKDVANIETLIKKLRAKSGTVSALVEKVTAWAERETDKFTKAKKPQKVSDIADTADIIYTLCEDARSVDQVLEKFNEAFSDEKGPGITLSSVHKSKGLEWGRVFLLQNTFYPGGDASLEEANLEYVAITRAMRELVIVSAPKVK